MIQAEAFRLFAERGYGETTVEQIADAAAISPRTFFRYFPTKEDVVLWDEYDPIALELLESRPIGESPVNSMRAIIRQTLTGLLERDREQLLARIRLIGSVPELRARFLDYQATGHETLADLFAQNRGLADDELELRVTSAALVAAVTVALDRWQRDDGKGDLLALIDDAFRALGAGTRDLQPELPRRGLEAEIQSAAADHLDDGSG
jgi:AcrR family transcriptional regulator